MHLLPESGVGGRQGRLMGERRPRRPAPATEVAHQKALYLALQTEYAPTRGVIVVLHPPSSHFPPCCIHQGPVYVYCASARRRHPGTGRLRSGAGGGRLGGGGCPVMEERAEAGWAVQAILRRNWQTLAVQ